MLPRKTVSGVAGEGASILARNDTKILAKCPALVQHLTLCRYDDGQPRQPGVMILLAKGKTWQLILKEPDTKAKLVVIQDTVDECLLGAEMLLTSPDTLWEIDQYEQPNAKGRGRK